MKLNVRLLGVVLAIGGVVSIAHATFPASTPALVMTDPSPEPSTRKPLVTQSASEPTTDQGSKARHRRAKHRSATHAHKRRKKAHHKKGLHKNKTRVHHRRSRHKESSGGVAQPQVLLNMNRATLAELENLPGVDPVLAQHILIVRDGGGGFDDLDDLLDVEGMTPAKLSRLESLLSF